MREELKDYDFEVITVALDSGGADAAREAIERAKPTHPSLIDQRHIVADLYGIVNVPTAVWIDEHGMIVRPAETPASSKGMADILGVGETEYLDAVRDWAKNGAQSRYVLSSEERLRRQHAPDANDALAAAYFRLGEYLIEHSEPEAARPYIDEAQRLRPESWTYRRQAWAMYDPAQNVGRGWYEAAMATGDVPYYPAPQLGDAAALTPAETAEMQRERYRTLFGSFMDR